MNETLAIIRAFDEAHGEGCALATVVSVEGSAYRRPGARMLITASGESAGTISAGCLENDVIAHAQQVIASGRAKLVDYDTSSTGAEMAWGLSLGCNGVVRVLVEPLDAQSPYLAAVRATLAAQSNVAIATLFRHLAAQGPQIAAGSRLIIDEAGKTISDIADDELAALIENESRAARRDTSSGVRVSETANGVAEIFIETLAPPVKLIVFGAGHDALPIVELAHRLGWRTEVVDNQAREASRERFACADKVTLARPEAVTGHVAIASGTLALLMTHNYAHDCALLEFLLASPARYIGVLGPRKRTERMLRELSEDGFALADSDRARLYAPAGLDIGADSSQEIALAIIAEMRAVLAGREGGSLRRRRMPIHDPQPAQLESMRDPASCPDACAVGNSAQAAISPGFDDAKEHDYGTTQTRKSELRGSRRPAR